jgi:glycosyltransferase involved in cell wall biosynthesis
MPRPTLLRGLDEKIAVTVLATDPKVGRFVAGFRPDADLRCVPPVRNKFDFAPILAHFRALRGLRPDILHVNLRIPYACQYGILAGLFTPGVRVVAVEHCPLDTQSGFSRWIKRRSSARLAAHVAVGKQGARMIENEAHLPPNSLRVIHNGVPELESEPLPRLASGPVIGSIGRFDRLKGYEVLVKAMPELPGVTVVLIGGGPMREELEELARELRVEDRLILIDWSDEPRRYLAGFDLFVLPSRLEALPLVLVEAMLAKLPVVATDVGGVSECVAANETGLLVAVEDATALASAIQRLLAEPALRTQFGEAGSARARRLFSLERMVEEYDALYRDVMSGVAVK